MGKAKEPEDRTQFVMRMRPELAEALDAEGVRWDRSRNWLIERACELWLKRLQAGRERRGKK